LTIGEYHRHELQWQLPAARANRHIRPIVLKNPLAKPFTLAIWAIFCGFQLQVRQANWVFTSFSPA
jgi:hypothetical protein